MLNRIRALLRRTTGLDLEQGTVDRAVRARMQALQLTDTGAYTAQLAPHSPELDALIDQVVIPETWFMREPEAFAAAARAVAEKRAAGVQPVRILCLPCASGEEPYSLAIALQEHGVAPDDFVLHGADISLAALERAQRAVYQRNAFRGTTPAFRARYFTAAPEGAILLPQVKERVMLRRANLFDSAAFAPGEQYDLIFCRNLLIYFDETRQRSAIRRLRHLLRRDGVLFTGHAEAVAFCRHGFVPAPYPRAFALRLQQPQLRPPLAPPSMPPLARAASAPAISAAGGHTPQRTNRPAAQQPERALTEAQVLADQGKLDEAARLYRRYLQHAPDSADAHFMLGLVSERMQDLTGAERWLRRAVYLNPNHYEALCHLALLQERHGAHGPADALRRRAARVYQRNHEGGPRR